MEQKSQIQAFAKSLTKQEKTYLWNHVFRYAGVEGTTSTEQFERLIGYVLNFLETKAGYTAPALVDGDSEMEEKIFAKALKMFEMK